MTLILAAAVFITGCTLNDASAVRRRIIHYAEDLFSQSTVTMPVLVTATPTATNTMTPTATLTPTVTMTPTMTKPVTVFSSPTFEVLNTAELPLSVKDDISDVSDVTVPDDTVLEPGQLFIKSWRMTNNGENTWENGTKLMMEPNYDMGMPEVVKAVFIKANDWIDFTPGGWGSRIHNVGPGTEADLAVILKAPSEPGAYQIHFRLVNNDGEIITTPFWMRFAVSRPTETPTPSPTAESGTPEPEMLPYDWNGRWMVREPFKAEGITPVNAWLQQNGDEVTGFLYDSQGDPIIIRGALTENGRQFNGELFYPWQKDTTAVTWRMQASRDQFHAVTERGVIDSSTVCGARGEKNFPASCALPAGA